MLTLIERIHQSALKKSQAERYPITYVVPTPAGVNRQYSTWIYANSKEDAASLGAKIQQRTAEKLTHRGELARWGFDLGEIKSNKLGLILPWRDPVNRRSIKNGVQLPAQRALATLKSIQYYANKQNVINKAGLSREQINHYLTQTVYSGFTTFTLLIIGSYLTLLGITSDQGFISKYGFSALFVFTYCTITFFKIHLSRKKLLTWREELDE